MMAFEDENDYNHIVSELNQAFRITDKWSHDDRLNSVTSYNVFKARYLLQSAIENLSLTEDEIEERDRQEERKGEELAEEEWEAEQDELRQSISDIIEHLQRKEPHGKLTHPQTHVLGRALQDCLSRRPLSEDEVTVILSFLREY